MIFFDIFLDDFLDVFIDTSSRIIEKTLSLFSDDESNPNHRQQHAERTGD